MTGFDTIVMVDWSAAATPKTGADSIWVAVLRPGDAVPKLLNPPTRAALFPALASLNILLRNVTRACVRPISISSEHCRATSSPEIPQSSTRAISVSDIPTVASCRTIRRCRSSGIQDFRCFRADSSCILAIFSLLFTHSATQSAQ